MLSLTVSAQTHSPTDEVIRTLSNENKLLYQKITLDSIACEQRVSGYRTGLEKANAERTQMGNQINQQSQQIEGLGAQLDECGSRLSTAETKLKRYEPTTFFGKAVKTVKNVCTLTGATVIVIGATIITLKVLP